MVKGGPETARAFARTAQDSNDMRQAHDEIEDFLLDAIRERTREDTGLLQDSWIAYPDSEQASFTNPLDYSLPQEYGTGRGVEPTNAIRESIEAHEDAITGAYAGAVAEIAFLPGSGVYHC
jgi:hypothetical protein